VTLDEIEQMVKDGEEIRIIDNSTKNDITHITLAHIIFEQEKSSKGKLPVSALRGIIQSGEEFIQRLQSPVNQFRDEFKKRAEVVGEGSKALRDFIDGTQKSIDDMQRRMDDRMRDAVDQLTHIPELRKESDAMELRVSQLEARIAQLERALGQIQPVRDVTASNPQRDIPDPTRRYH
jgi:polyhydroxyalkanoate synthesis regulator protein